MHSLKCKPQKIDACFPAQVTLMAKVKLQNGERQEQRGRRKGENKQSRALQTKVALWLTAVQALLNAKLHIADHSSASFQANTEESDNREQKLTFQCFVSLNVQ